jgi:hypothetical protein
MQLKILISIICLILSSHSYTTLKNEKKTSLRSVTYSKQGPALGASSQFTWTLMPAMKLFKEIALTVFDAKDPNEIRRCVENVENNSDLGQTPYKELWDKCVQINKEYFSKVQMEQAAKGGVVAPDRLAALKSFSNWDDVLIGEFKALIGGSRNDGIKTDCLPVFTKTRGTVMDFMAILQKPDFMGGKVVGGKDDHFIDSQYSIYRQKIAPGAFKRLNDASDKLMGAYRGDIKALPAARGIPKAPGPYDGQALKPGVFVPVSLLIFFISILFLIFKDKYNL